MAIAPIPVRPGPPSQRAEAARARLVAVLVAVGIAAALVAYAASPAVRHAVGHAAHSVKGAVGHVLDRDAKPATKPGVHAPSPSRSGAGHASSGATTPAGTH